MSRRNVQNIYLGDDNLIKQRSKEELLAVLKTGQALKKDAERKDNIAWKTVFFRMNVIWCVSLWKDEKFSQKELVDFLTYVRSFNLDDFKKNRRNVVQEKLKSKGIDWVINETGFNTKVKSEIDKMVVALMRYNTEATVDYSLVACEYLMDKKGFGRKRLNRVIGNVYYLDNFASTEIVKLRKELYNAKGIWIELCENEMTEQIDCERI